MCRWTRHTQRHGSLSFSPTPRRVPRSPPQCTSIAWTEPACRSSTSMIPASTATRTRHCRAPEADEIAYLIYTSGTTGTPKGVGITHHNLTHLAASMPIGLPANQVWTQCHSYAFDFSVWEIWAALLTGGRLVVVPEEVTSSPETFHDVLVSEAVNVLTQTPSAVAALSPEGLGSTALLLGGESCPSDVVDRWAPGRVVINAYGPTEATVYASMSAPLTTPEAAGPRVVPIGAPVSTSALFVLDQWLHPVPRRGGGRVVRGRPRCGVRVHRPVRIDRVAVRRHARSSGRKRPQPGCTAPVTWCVGMPTASCVTWGVPTSRSRSVATASNSGRSEQHWPIWTG